MRGITLVLLWIAVVVTATMTVVAASSSSSTRTCVNAMSATCTKQPASVPSTVAGSPLKSPSVHAMVAATTATATATATADCNETVLASNVGNISDCISEEVTGMPTKCSASMESNAFTTSTTLWNDFSSWPPLGLIGIAMFTVFALIAHPDGLAWVLIGKINVMFQAVAFILREFWVSVLGGGTGILPTVLAATTLAGLALLLISMMNKLFSSRRKQSRLKPTESPPSRKKKKRRNQNSRHKRKPRSSDESNSLSSDSGHRSFAEADVDVRTETSAISQTQIISPSTVSTDTSPSKPSSTREKPEPRCPSETSIPFRKNAPSTPPRTKSKKQPPKKQHPKKHPETVSIPNIDTSLADDQSCESSISMPSLGNNNSTQKLRPKKQRKPKNQKETNSPTLLNRRPEKHPRGKNPKAAPAPAPKKDPLIPSNRWDVLKPSANLPPPPPQQQQPSQPSPRHQNSTPRGTHHHTPRSNGSHNAQLTPRNNVPHNAQQSPRNHVPHNAQQTPRSNSRRANKKNRNAALNNSRHKSTPPSTKFSASPPSSKRSVSRSKFTPTPIVSSSTKQVGPFPGTPGSTVSATPTMLAPPPGLTRSTPSDDFFDPTPAPILDSSLLIPETTDFATSTPRHPGIVATSSPFELGISTNDSSTWSTPSRFSSSPVSLYGGFASVGTPLKENPFAPDEDDSQIEADLRELGGQMAGSILDF